MRTLSFKDIGIYDKERNSSLLRAVPASSDIVRLDENLVESPCGRIATGRPEGEKGEHFSQDNYAGHQRCFYLVPPEISILSALRLLISRTIPTRSQERS